MRVKSSRRSSSATPTSSTRSKVAEALLARGADGSPITADAVLVAAQGRGVRGARPR